MNVAGALFERLGDHGVHEPNDRRFARHVAQVFEVFLIARSELCRSGLTFAFAEVAVDGVEDVLFVRQLGADFKVRKTLDRVDGFEVERVGHRER